MATASKESNLQEVTSVTESAVIITTVFYTYITVHTNDYGFKKIGRVYTVSDLSSYNLSIKSHIHEYE